jgi:hypothetical protein
MPDDKKTYCSRCGAPVPETPVRIDHNGDPVCRACFLETGCPGCRAKDANQEEIASLHGLLRDAGDFMSEIPFKALEYGVQWSRMEDICDRIKAVVPGEEKCHEG